MVEYAKSMPKLCLHYAKSMPRLWMALIWVVGFDNGLEGGLLNLLCELVDDFLGIHVQLLHHLSIEVDGEVLYMYNGSSLFAFYVHGACRFNRYVGHGGGAVIVRGELAYMQGSGSKQPHQHGRCEKGCYNGRFTHAF